MIFEEPKNYIYKENEIIRSKVCLFDINQDLYVMIYDNEEINKTEYIFGTYKDLLKLNNITDDNNEIISSLEIEDNNIFDSYDIIIAGYGTTSSCILDQLNDVKLKILVINQGPRIEDENVRDLNNFYTVWKNPKYTTIIGISETNNNVTQGRIIGGSSMHNGCVAIKPTKIFLESMKNGNLMINDYGLPIEITSTNEKSNIIIDSISDIFGIKNVNNYNEHEYSISPNLQSFTKENGERSMLSELIDNLSDNITVIEGFCIDLIFKESINKVIGINTKISNEIYKIYGTNVILSAGINSSIILERSGIISKSTSFELENKEIRLINNNVGNNIKNQVGPSICIRLPEEYIPKTNNLGILGMGFIPIDNKRKYQLMITKYPYLNKSITDMLDIKNTISINICDLNQNASGEIHIISDDINSQPLINLKTYQNKEDIYSGLNSMQFLELIYEKIKLDIPEAELVFPTKSILQHTSIEKILSFNSLVTEHYTSSCRMGHNINDSVVDFNFKVHEIDNLFICDASVFPYCPDGNPQYACMLIGLEFGNRIKLSLLKNILNKIL